MKVPAKNIKPYSSFGETGENVPALKHFFRCLEGAGNSLFDDIGGVELDASLGGFTTTWDSTNHAVSWSMLISSQPIANAAGEWCRIYPTNKVLVLAVFDVLSPNSTEYVRCSIGDINGHLGTTIVKAGLGMSGSPPHCAFTADTSTGTRKGCYTTIATGPEVGPGAPNYDAAAFTTSLDPVDDTYASTHGGFVYTYDGTTSNTYKFINADSSADVVTCNYTHGATYKDLTVTPTPNLYDPVGGPYRDNFYEQPPVWDLNPATGIADGTTYMQPNPAWRFANIRLYGYALFVFNDTLPADWQTAYKWMANQWRQGNRVIYPGWIGKT